MIDIIRLDTAESTNNSAAKLEKDLPATALVYTHTQTSGRGQKGNSWESEPYKNITASLLFHPQDFPANRQFALSEMIALCISDFLSEQGADTRIKWPNDIYTGDRKICGILVEHVVTGKTISRTIAGFGININQKEFRSDAPNPVSLTMLTGKEYDIEELLGRLAEKLEEYIDRSKEPGLIHEAFLARLWRNDGKYYPFNDRKSRERIEARIRDVAPTGMMTLELRDGTLREYAFKEVEFVV